jgi:hypothetical protein
MIFELEKQLHQKQYILQKTTPRTFFNKEVLYDKFFFMIIIYFHTKK